MLPTDQTSSTVAAPDVWDRVWRHVLSDEKDEAILARERASRRWRLSIERMERTFGRIDGLRTIELGSGRGDLSVLLAERGAEVTLLDRCPRALAEARRRFDRLGLPASFASGDLLGALHEQHERFDVALSVGVIEHFRGPARTRVLRAHHDVLRPGGLAIVSVPHAHCPPYRLWKAYLELRGWWPYGLEIPYSRGEMLRRGRDAGFDRMETNAYGFRQSVGEHLGRGLLRRKAECPDRPSMLDECMGSVLLMFAWRVLSEPRP